jgi:hypothetical protein
MAQKRALRTGFNGLIPDTPYAIPPGPHRILTSVSNFSYSTTVGGVYTALTTPNTEPGVLLDAGFIKNTAAAARFLNCKKVPILSTYAGEVAKSGPLLYYRLNEKAGSTLFDAYSRANCSKGSAIVLDQPSALVNGDGNTAALWDGTTNSICTSSNSINTWFGASAITFEAWVKNASWSATHEMVVSLGGVGHYLSVEDKKVFMSLIIGSQRTNYALGNPLAVDTWYHVAGTWKSGDPLRLYINGVLQTPNDNTARTGTLATGANIWLGSFNNTLLITSGLLDEIAVYLRQLTADELMTHYSQRSSKA